MSANPPALEPPAALLEAVGEDELEPQAANNTPANIMTSNMLIKVIVRLFIIMMTSSRGE
jgi:hypothetical protein